jgi:uncharacterized damage-inducible protein DinB
MEYSATYIDDGQVPRAAAAVFQHLLETYASETNKTAAVWDSFTSEDLAWRPDAKSADVAGIMRHQLLSERRFFAEFLGSPEPEAAAVLPAESTVAAFRARLVELALPRLRYLAAFGEADWLAITGFFDARRQRIWIFWRRVLHSAHHRTQLTVYLRMLDKKVPPTYGPTADVTWSGADPTLSVNRPLPGQR